LQALFIFFAGACALRKNKMCLQMRWRSERCLIEFMKGGVNFIKLLSSNIKLLVISIIDGANFINHFGNFVNAGARSMKWIGNFVKPEGNFTEPDAKT
jgi:hypothetical protein